MVALIALLQSLLLAVSGPATSPEYLALRLADAEGHFAREGLAVTIRTTRSEVGAAEALAQGQAQLAATSLEALLRFGYRDPRNLPRLVFGLTAAPPVALLIPESLAATLTSVRQLAGLRIGVTSPGAPEQAWLNALLRQAGLDVTDVEIVSLGTRPLAAALNAGQVQAAVVPEPQASGLLADGSAALLVDLRSPEAAARAVGGPTVNAAVFARDRDEVHPRLLAAFARAVLAAERRIEQAPADALAGVLPEAVVGAPAEFEHRVQTARRLYLPGGSVTPAQLERTVAMIRAAAPLPASPRWPGAGRMLAIPPLTPRPPVTR
ncbi:MAG TPA: ABC transporter substrate-binding protein [Candidatus Binatia bacterium]|nr:ABC transporter substrate-binding protein [Candidatus Binatia bacterium]